VAHFAFQKRNAIECQHLIIQLIEVNFVFLAYIFLTMIYKQYKLSNEFKIRVKNLFAAKLRLQIMHYLNHSSRFLSFLKIIFRILIGFFQMQSALRFV